MDKIEISISDQYKQIKKGGLPLLIRKSFRAALLILALPIALLLRILKPFVIVRLGPLPSERIGRFAVYVESYLNERDDGRHNPKNFDVFYYFAQICNYQLKKMWDRTLRIYHFAKYIDKASRLLPGAKQHLIPLSYDRDIDGLFNRIKPHLKFLPQEEELGKVELNKLGIPDGSPFVCFHARDSAYLDTMLLRKRDWSYHDFRDSNIHNLIPMAEKLTQQGYYAVRMGARVKEALNTTNSKIIDYAINGRTEFLDIYLGAKCSFFICDSAGIYAVPRMFRRPIVFVNYVPLEYVFSSCSNSLFIPKKLWLKQEHRFLTFQEILSSEVGRFLRSEQYKESGIEVIENTPEEITAVTVEMVKRLKGQWQTTTEDERLQQSFWGLFKPSELNKVFLSRIGTEFLRQNRELLGEDIK